MADSQVISYIQKNIELGYSIEDVKQSLYRAGYTANQVNGALDYMQAQQYYGTNGGSTQSKFSGPHINLGAFFQNPKHLFLLAAIVVILAFGLFLFLSSGNERIVLPDDRPVPLNDDVPEQDGDDEPFVDPFEDDTPSVNNNDRITDEPQVVPNNLSPSQLSRLQIDDKIEELAPTKPDEAITYCDLISTRAGKITCTTKVAYLSEDYTYCDDISQVHTRDSCYLNFALHEVSDSSVCQHIANEYKKGSCYDLYEVYNTIETGTLNTGVTIGDDGTSFEELTDEELRDFYTVSAFE